MGGIDWFFEDFKVVYRGSLGNAGLLYHTPMQIQPLLCNSPSNSDDGDEESHRVPLTA